MKKILLPTDFSDNSWNAIKYALQLLKDEDCSFTILHTYTPIIYQVEFVLIGPAQNGLGDAIRDVAEGKMKALLDRIDTEFPNSKHQFEGHCIFSTLITEIKELTEKKQFDYVIMGTKGATGAKEVLFGSNTVQVFKHVKCPILAIPDDFEFERPLEILFPSDYEVTFTESHIKPLLDIAKAYNSRINVMHVSFGYELTDTQKKNRDLLEIYFGSVAHLFHDMRHENLTDAIDEFQLKARVNLLVMLNNKHSFFENLFFKSTLNQIGFHLNIPFLVIPSQL
ncbi:universal stress protein [Winogradskyella aurantia]|uniref:Universal stress protein n=1 Tax=Winogradskyella aurantia TaxID=1915063 RepID=A0A265UXU5_9FLAO|nr:universal stress protein [Winogradskyella aurantia]OZV70133.1 universal stress protein [Winogradskyella aurantia]